jgi:hypothetical protein
VPAGDDSPATVVLVADDGREVVLGPVRAPGAGFALVDTLARLQLRAQRRGWTVRLREVSPQLQELLQLVGLAGVLGVEAGGEPELGEELGVQEVVEPGDPPV